MFYLKATLLTATVILVLVNFSSCVEKKSTKGTKYLLSVFKLVKSKQDLLSFKIISIAIES